MLAVSTASGGPTRAMPRISKALPSVPTPVYNMPQSPSALQEQQLPSAPPPYQSSWEAALSPAARQMRDNNLPSPLAAPTPYAAAASHPLPPIPTEPASPPQNQLPSAPSSQITRKPLARKPVKPLTSPIDRSSVESQSSGSAAVQSRDSPEFNVKTPSEKVDVARGLHFNAPSTRKDLPPRPAAEQQVSQLSALPSPNIHLPLHHISPTFNAEADLPPPPPPSKDVLPTANPPRSHLPQASAPPPVEKSTTPQVVRKPPLQATERLDLNISYTSASTPWNATTTTGASSIQLESRPSQETLKSSPIPSLPGAGLAINPDRSLPANTSPNAAGSAQVNKDSMGNRSSKIQNLKNKLLSSHSRTSSGATARELAAPPTANRPPTPEYQIHDVKTPLQGTILSPVSPASSPEPQHDVSTSASGTAAGQPMARKSPVAGADLRPAQSVPNFRGKASSPSMEPLPSPNFIPAAGRDRSGSDASRSRGRDSPMGQHYRVRDSSANPSVRHSLRPTSSPNPGSDPRLVRSESGDWLYRGRDGTLYPEMKELREPDPRAMRFPALTPQISLDTKVFKAPPLTERHYSCFQKHRTMTRRPNTRYALSCQTCNKEDLQDRWSCTFCHLRICESCANSMRAHQGDLRKVMVASGQLVEAASGSPSHSRSGSTLGLNINF